MSRCVEGGREGRWNNTRHKETLMLIILLIIVFALIANDQ